jgi:hypothetical protein
LAIKRNRTDLIQLISLAEKGVIDFDHVERWNRFKKEWSEEDIIFWNKLKNRMTKDESGVLRLDSPLSIDEKMQAKIFVQRAEERYLC